MSKDNTQYNVREFVHSLLDNQKKWVLGTGSSLHYAYTEDLLVMGIKGLINSEVRSVLERLEETSRTYEYTDPFDETETVDNADMILLSAVQVEKAKYE